MLGPTTVTFISVGGGDADGVAAKPEKNGNYPPSFLLALLNPRVNLSLRQIIRLTNLAQVHFFIVSMIS